MTLPRRRGEPRPRLEGFSSVVADLLEQRPQARALGVLLVLSPFIALLAVWAVRLALPSLSLPLTF